MKFIPALPDLAWVLLNMICIPLFRALNTYRFPPSGFYVQNMTQLLFRSLSCRNIYNKMPWHNSSISVSELQVVSAPSASGDEPTETAGATSGPNVSESKDAHLETPNLSAEVGHERPPRPVAIVFGMKRSPRMNQFGDGVTRAADAEEVTSPREVLETERLGMAESSITKIAPEREEMSVSNPKSVGENRISVGLPQQQPCVCGSDCCQSVVEVMTLPIMLQWKGDCFSSAPTHVKSEVFSEGTMRNLSSYSVNSHDVVLRETLV